MLTTAAAYLIILCLLNVKPGALSNKGHDMTENPEVAAINRPEPDYDCLQDARTESEEIGCSK